MSIPYRHLAASNAYHYVGKESSFILLKRSLYQGGMGIGGIWEEVITTERAESIE